MAGQDKQHRMSFASVSGKRVEATFDGGILTSLHAAGRRQRGDAASRGGVQDRHSASDR